MAAGSFLFFLWNWIPVNLSNFVHRFAWSPPADPHAFLYPASSATATVEESTLQAPASLPLLDASSQHTSVIRSEPDKIIARTSVLLCSLAGTMTVTSNASSIACFPVIRNKSADARAPSVPRSKFTTLEGSSDQVETLLIRWLPSLLAATTEYPAMTEYPSSSPRHADVVRVCDGRRPVPTSRLVICQSLQKKKKKRVKRATKKKQLWLEQHLCETLMETPDALHFQQICCISVHRLLVQKSQHDQSPTTQNGVPQVRIKSPVRAEEPTRLVTNNSKWCSNKNEITCSCRRVNTIGHQQLKMVFEQARMKSPARAEELTGLCECLLPHDLVGLGFICLDGPRQLSFFPAESNTCQTNTCRTLCTVLREVPRQIRMLSFILLPVQQLLSRKALCRLQHLFLYWMLLHSTLLWSAQSLPK